MEEDYPYTAETGDCTFDAKQTNVSVMTMGWETLPHNDLLAVMEHLANKGPLSVAVASSDWSLHMNSNAKLEAQDQFQCRRPI